MASRNEIKERSYAFAVRIVRLSRVLASERTGQAIVRQLLRSGTSIGANVEEAQGAQSRKNFISKLAIARKEARETYYWLRLLRDAELVPAKRLAQIINECEQLLRILTVIIKSTEKGNKIPQRLQSASPCRELVIGNS